MIANLHFSFLWNVVDKATPTDNSINTRLHHTTPGGRGARFSTIYRPHNSGSRFTTIDMYHDKIPRHVLSDNFTSLHLSARECLTLSCSLAVCQVLAVATCTRSKPEGGARLPTFD